jgi:hypothetical protein
MSLFPGAQTETDLIVRPAFGGAHTRARRRRALAFLPLAVVGFIRLTLWPALVCLVAVAIISAAAYGLTARTNLALVTGTIRRRSWLGRTRSVARSEVARVVELKLLLTRLGEPETYALFLGGDGRCLLRVPTSLYRPSDMESFRSALDRPWEALPDPVKPTEVRRSYPASFGPAWEHFLLLTTLLTFVLIAVVSAAIALAGR